MATDKMPEPGFFDKHREKIAFAGPDECWQWIGAISDDYGTVRVRGTRKVRKAHREAFESVQGAGSAEGLVVRHRCDNPSCVNPRHLLLGTQADNMRDKMDRGRHVAVRGSSHGMSKLDETTVSEILAACVLGSRTHGARALARKHGVSKALICQIINGETWAHVARPSLKG